MIGKVATLNHKVLDDSVERRSRVAITILASRQHTEVLNRLGHRITIETHHNATERFVAMVDIKEDLLVILGPLAASTDERRRKGRRKVTNRWKTSILEEYEAK